MALHRILLSAGSAERALTLLRRWTDIFDSSLSKLGLLTPEEVAAVLDAYLPLKELLRKFAPRWSYRSPSLSLPSREEKRRVGPSFPQSRRYAEPWFRAGPGIAA